MFSLRISLGTDLMDTITTYKVQECVHDTHLTYVILCFSFSLVQFLYFFLTPCFLVLISVLSPVVQFHTMRDS